MHVLITGGAGYIGTELAYELAGDPAVNKITIYDNLSRGNVNLFLGLKKLNEKLRFVEADILDTRTLRKYLADVDVVYHLAAKVSTPFADHSPHLFEQVNHWGTAELTYAIDQSPVQRLIYLSSSSVYGASSEAVDEDSPANPRTFYGISKMRGEKHSQRILENRPGYIIRCGNVYGYGRSMRLDSVINRFVFDAHLKNRITINGNGEQHRSFIHIDKTANILARLATSDLPSGLYNLAEDTLQINYIADTLKTLYPDLEMLYINQDLAMRELKVRPNNALNALTTIPVRTLKDVLTTFQEAFTF